MKCPLCDGDMVDTGGYMTCQQDTNHAIHIQKELERFYTGEKDMSWLRNRMKVRLGKNVAGR